MRHVFACAHLWTRIKCLNNAFFCMPKLDMNLSRRVVFCTLRKPTNELE